jgi:hypothetical protein
MNSNDSKSGQKCLVKMEHDSTNVHKVINLIALMLRSKSEKTMKRFQKMKV